MYNMMKQYVLYSRRHMKFNKVSSLHCKYQLSAYSQYTVDECTHSKIKLYTHKKKYWPGRDFSRQISTVLGNFLKKYLRYRSFIYLIGKP